MHLLSKILDNCEKVKFRKDLELGIKYCPGLELLKYTYIEYKPRYSAKRCDIYTIGTFGNNKHILSSETVLQEEPDDILMASVWHHGGDGGRDGQDGDLQGGQAVLRGGRGVKSTLLFG